MKLTNERKLYIEFSLGCAIRVLPIFEKKYPYATEPRLALEAVKNFLNNPSGKNLKLVNDTAAAAAAADAHAAYAAADAAFAAAAAYDTAAAAYAATAAAYAATAAASDTAADAYADAFVAADAASERKWQLGFLQYLNFKYSLNIAIKGVQ